MKILYISPQAIPSRSANSVHMMKMAQAMGRKHDVTLRCFLPRPPDRVEQGDVFSYYHVVNNFKLSRFPNLGKGILNRLAQIAFALQNGFLGWGYDLVFSRCLLSACAAALLGNTVVFELHDSPNSYNPLLLQCFQWLKARKKLVALIVISDALKHHVVEQFGIDPTRIIVAHDGADPIITDNAPCSFDKKGFDFHAGYTGHLYAGRGIDIIAGTAKYLTNIAFHIVGGQPADIAFWKAQFPGLKNLFFHGHVEHAAVANFLSHFDVLLAPYQRKVAVAGNTGDTSAWMSPLKIFEYMSSGRPIICSDLPVLTEILQHRHNAYLCAPDIVREWAEAITALQNTPDFAKKIAQKAKQDFERSYTWQKRADAILHLLTLHGRTGSS